MFNKWRTLKAEKPGLGRSKHWLPDFENGTFINVIARVGKKIQNFLISHPTKRIIWKTSVDNGGNKTMILLILCISRSLDVWWLWQKVKTMMVFAQKCRFLWPGVNATEHYIFWHSVCMPNSAYDQILWHQSCAWLCYWIKLQIKFAIHEKDYKTLSWSNSNFSL